MHTTPAVRGLNLLFESELGSTPPTKWIWSEDLLYLQNKYDKSGAPVYETQLHGILLVRVQAKEKAKIFEDLKNQWVACYLTAFPDSESGQIHGTGEHVWVPIGADEGRFVALDEGAEPTRELTLMICRYVKKWRATIKAKIRELEEKEMPSVPLDESLRHPKFQRLVTADEKKSYDETLEKIKDSHTAFLAVPGEKGHVSFPSGEQNGSSVGTN